MLKLGFYQSLVLLLNVFKTIISFFKVRRAREVNPRLGSQNGFQNTAELTSCSSALTKSPPWHRCFTWLSGYPELVTRHQKTVAENRHLSMTRCFIRIETQQYIEGLQLLPPTFIHKSTSNGWTLFYIQVFTCQRGLGNVVLNFSVSIVQKGSLEESGAEDELNVYIYNTDGTCQIRH